MHKVVMNLGQQCARCGEEKYFRPRIKEELINFGGFGENLINGREKKNKQQKEELAESLIKGQIKLRNGNGHHACI